MSQHRTNVRCLTTAYHMLNNLNVQLQKFKNHNMKLRREMEDLREQNTELLNQLEAARENSIAKVEQIKRVMSAYYQDKITAGQQALLESERRLQEVQQRLQEEELQLKDSREEAYKFLQDRHAQEMADLDSRRTSEKFLY